MKKFSVWFSPINSEKINVAQKIISSFLEFHPCISSYWSTPPLHLIIHQYLHQCEEQTSMIYQKYSRFKYISLEDNSQINLDGALATETLYLKQFTNKCSQKHFKFIMDCQ